MDDTNSVTLKNAFKNSDSHPLFLDLLLIRKYGIDYLGWSYETLDTVIPKDFGMTVSSYNMQKIAACQSLHLVDTFWSRWETFGWITSGLHGVPPDPNNTQLFTVAQYMVAVDTATKIQSQNEFSDEVKAYVRSVYMMDHIAVPVEPLDFVTLDVSDYPVNVQKITERWPVVRSSKQAPHGNTIEDEQLRKMLAAHIFLEDSRSRLNAQMSLLKDVVPQ